MSDDFSQAQDGANTLPVAKRPSAQFLELATNFSRCISDEMRINELSPADAFEKVRLEFITKRAVSGIGLVAICAALPLSALAFGAAALPIEVPLLSVASAAFGVHYGNKAWSLLQDSRDVVRCFKECGADRPRFHRFIAHTRQSLGLKPPSPPTFSDMA